MNQPLTTKQYVPLTDDERRVLRHEAAERGLSTGLLARALVLHGIDRLDDPAVGARIEHERAASTARTSAGARMAVRARWGTDGSEDER